ncbi:MAG: Transcriptional repressor SdpR [Firmicutes bacterium ADurb.Bin182]|nr:MAG: Transcriptional repressor SdpR [Firmicutes bacterium ADurb.Bin182]
MSNQREQTARVFKAFCDENRLMVLELLRDGEKCANSLLEELEIKQSTLSHHMKILCESGIVINRRQGKWTYYRLSKDGCEKAAELLKRVTLTDIKKSALGA